MEEELQQEFEAWDRASDEAWWKFQDELEPDAQGHDTYSHLCRGDEHWWLSGMKTCTCGEKTLDDLVDAIMDEYSDA